MAKKKITEIVAEELTPFLMENGYSLFHTEYVKEGRDWFLRIYIDSDSGVLVEDCEKVSHYISSRLDEMDPIERNYFLEVSSPGIDRPLIREEDYVRYKGRLVDVALYQAWHDQKQLTAELVGLTETELILTDGKTESNIPRDIISKVKLAVIF